VHIPAAVANLSPVLAGIVRGDPRYAQLGTLAWAEFRGLCVHNLRSRRPISLQLLPEAGYQLQTPDYHTKRRSVPIFTGA
jgi:hypothetical protein